VPLEDGLKESPKHVRQKQIRKLRKNLCNVLFITQFHKLTIASVLAVLVNAVINLQVS
jgi:hypothetical protein